MITNTDPRSQERVVSERRNVPLIALPDPKRHYEQDSEWCLVKSGDHWREIRFHDYAKIYEVPGLYEHLFHEVLNCTSPVVIAELLKAHVENSDRDFSELNVLDLGAGNGLVGLELRRLGCGTIIGADILQAAKEAALRDRPQVYDDYLVGDITQLVHSEHDLFRQHRLNCLTSVAAIGFGDIPPEVFAAAYNVIDPGGLIAFNIKEDFLEREDSTGYARLIQRCAAEGILSIDASKHYRHRNATNGDPLIYAAIIGRKNKDIDRRLLSSC